MGSAAIEVGPTSVPQMVMLVVQLLAHQERVRQSIGERREVDVGSQAVTGPLDVGGVGRVAVVPPLGDCPLIVAIAPITQAKGPVTARSEEHTSELQSHLNLVC